MQASKVEYEVEDLPGQVLTCRLQEARESFRLLAAAKKTSSIRSEPKRAEVPTALNAIDALRFGLVPADRINELSMHNKELEALFRRALPYEGKRPRLRMNLVEGAWGQGKSHTKEWLLQRAIDEGYLVASIEVDGVNLTFADTKNLLFEMLRTVRGKELSASAPVLDLYTKAVERGYGGPELYHGAVQRNQINYDIVAALRRQNVLAEVDDILEMHLTSSPEMAAADVRRGLAERLRGTAYAGGIGVSPLIGQSVEGRPFDLMVALFAIAAIAVAQGSRGLIVSFDEWEVQASSSTAQKRMLQQMKVMEFFFLDERYSAQPISFVVFNVPGGDGPEAKAEADIVEALVSASSGARYRIPLLDGWDRQDKEVKGLAQRIHAVYVEAYAINEPMGEKEYWRRLDEGMAQVDFQESGATRMMLKMIVSVLDAAYGPPQRESFSG